MVSARTSAPWTADTTVALGVVSAASVSRRAVTRYPVMTDPPLFAGEIHLAVALTAPPATPLVAVPITGALGTVAGVTSLEAAEGALSPMALVAVTVKW